MKKIILSLLLSTSILYAQTTIAPIYTKEFTACGQSEFEFSLNQWGRISLQVVNSEGVELQLIDKKQGVRRKEGTAGHINGRIDEYLDVGTYKIIANASHNGSSKATIAVFPFKELNSPEYLQQNKEYETELTDLQQRSFWIEVPDTMTIILEALGRNLSDVQFWQDGQWRIDLAASSIKSLQNTGTPIKGFRVIQFLKKGYYLVSFYGGPSLDWASQADKHPLFIKWGLTKIGSTSQRTDTISNQGYNQYIVYDNFSTALLSTSQKDKMYLHVIPFERQPRWSSGTIDSIHEKSVEPRILIEKNSGGSQVIRVSGSPGKVFTLTTLANQSAYSIKTKGNYWISSLTSHIDNHMLGVSGYIVNNSKDQKIVSLSVDTVSSGKSIKNEFNLLQKTSTYVWIDENGSYIAIPGGVKHSVTITRFFSDTKSSINETFDSKTKISLVKGLYKLSFSPEDKGIATFDLYKSDMISSISNMVFKDKKSSEISKKLFWQIPSITLDEDHYSLNINSLSPEVSSLIIRKLPLDLSEPLPIKTISGTSIPVKIRVNKKSYLNVTDEQGKHYPFSLSNKNCTSPLLLNEGEYTLDLNGSGEYLYAQSIPLEHFSNSPPRIFPTGKESPLTVFPSITEGKPDYFSLNRDDYAVYEVVITKPGIYNFTTSGRLYTSLKLRDRFTTNMLQQEANGVGRNALINSYLLPGTYQAVVSTRGHSAGRLGLHIERGNMIDGTELSINREKRFNVPAGDGIVYSVPIVEQGNYHFLSYCQDGDFTIRLDDAQGWPMVTPGSRGNLTINLKKGTYSLISLPEKRTRLRISKFSLEQKNKEYSGFGPHIIKINKPVTSIWNDDSLPSTGKPVIFVFTNPVSLKYTVSLTERFTAHFINSNKGDTIRHKGTSKLLLNRGTYSIHVYADENKSHEPYQLSITTDILTVGDAFTLYPTEKKEIKVAVGKSSVVELYSEGRLDVDATLTDSTGKRIAYNDDNSTDWNFTISKLLHPGVYTLSVSPQVNNYNNQTTIGMSALDDSTHKTWTSQKPVQLNLNHKIHSIPINTESHTIISAVIQGRSKVGACLEKFHDQKYSMIGQKEGELITLTAPVNTNSTYYLHVWSVDHIYEDITVSIVKSNPKEITINDLKTGITPELLPHGPLNTCWYKIDMQSDSINRFCFLDNTFFSQIETSDERNKVFSPVIESEVQSYKRYLWLELGSTKNGAQKIKTAAVTAPENKIFTIDHRPVTYHITTDNSTISVVKTEMKPGLPVSGIVSSKNHASVFPLSIPVQQGTLTPEHCAVTAILPNETNTVILWNGNQQSQHQVPTTIVSHHKYPVSSKSPLTTGFTSWDAPSNGAAAWAVDFQSFALLEITVPEKGLCIWADHSGNREIWSAFDRFSRFNLTVKQGTLYLINDTKPSTFSVHCLLHDKSYSYENQSYSSAISNISFKSSLRGVKRFPIVNNWQGDSVTLFYSDNITDVTWYSGNGSVKTDLKNNQKLKFDRKGKEGFLQISFNPGDHQVILCPNNTHSCFWGEEIKTDVHKSISGPAILNLDNTISWYKYTATKPEQITIKSNDVTAVTVVQNGKAIQTFNSSYGINGTVPLAPGDYTIGFKMNRNGNGNASVTFLAIPELREDKEMHLQLSSGETFFMLLKLAEKSKIGIGIPTDNEVFDLALYNKDLEPVASGKQVFTQLDKGTYYIGISIPFNHDAANCYLNLVGQNPPPDKPPQDVINYYLQFKDE